MKREPFDPAQLTIRPIAADLARAGDRPQFNARLPIAGIPKDGQALLRNELASLNTGRTVFALSRESEVCFATSEAELPNHLRLIDETLSRAWAEYSALCAKDQAGVGLVEKNRADALLALERISKRYAGR